MATANFHNSLWSPPQELPAARLNQLSGGWNHENPTAVLAVFSVGYPFEKGCITRYFSLLGAIE
ncbi:MAG TPA: hypothetical protein IGP91_06355 [Thermosynechococcus sp. M46_R2017_013]|uniref:hypothetical protein n=1 Tax=Thermosynechococcus sp. Uc TaxID=3034853 RepID=UPI0019D9592A|nr:hypothetical protein [Thermosynechococcus sp. Uc]HIK25386.1 hypothetical protein [Thermosynechococcus sp. M46_R2017_013]